MTQPAADPLMNRRNFYLGLIAKAQGDDFRTVPKSGEVLADRALFGSLSWCDLVFRVPIHEPGDQVEHTYHVARASAPVDLLLHRFTAGAVPVRVYEGSAFFAVFVPAAALAGSDAAEKAAQAARLLLSVDPLVVFKPIAADPQHHAYSTDPDRTALRIGDWKRRIDAVIGAAELVLVVYKSTYDDMMTLSSDPAAWFEDLRTAK
jgi:hypothetical protein